MAKVDTGIARMTTGRGVCVNVCVCRVGTSWPLSQVRGVGTWKRGVGPNSISWECCTTSLEMWTPICKIRPSGQIISSVSVALSLRLQSCLDGNRVVVTCEHCLRVEGARYDLAGCVTLGGPFTGP